MQGQMCQFLMGSASQKRDRFLGRCHSYSGYKISDLTLKLSSYLCWKICKPDNSCEYYKSAFMATGIYVFSCGNRSLSNSTCSKWRHLHLNVILIFVVWRIYIALLQRGEISIYNAWFIAYWSIKQSRRI